MDTNETCRTTCDSRSRKNWAGLAIGIGVGVALASAFHDAATGLSIGAGLALALHLAFNRKKD